jgi:hypothetical protein
MLTVFSNGSSLGDQDTVGSLKGRDATQGELCEESGLLGLGHVDGDFLYGFTSQGGDGLDTLDTPVVWGMGRSVCDGRMCGKGTYWGRRRSFRQPFLRLKE